MSSDEKAANALKAIFCPEMSQILALFHSLTLYQKSLILNSLNMEFEEAENNARLLDGNHEF